MQTSDENVAEVLNRLREEVRLRRERLHGSELSELRSVIKQANELWNVSAHLPITWGTPPLIGRAIAYAKRITRLLLRWYINPIVEQQNNYNAATTRALLQLNAYLEQLTREGHDMEQRIASLEEQLKQKA
ncbi:MAG: hypothetical protein HXX08_12465 [Chloroflexi bacterium]|uniref:Uncharacterized protein n=1 Tax=Candidatus Chlorohelix allophototropha TaxID=3003348 RepID=A0A8T7M3I5_9CHLR|nr:hypothetical protein [Chloroflexota bacterium]WJW66056.1 hypothetical protein OZ401_001838 [Chloroflexota bacterium L227-S17]